MINLLCEQFSAKFLLQCFCMQLKECLVYHKNWKKFLFSVHNRYIVTGDVAGHVRFLDQQLRLTNWLSIEYSIEVNDYLLICVLKSKSLKGAWRGSNNWKNIANPLFHQFDIVMIKTCECVCYDITINTDTVFIKHMLVVTILTMVVRHQAKHCITLIVFCFWSFTGTNTSMQGLLAQSHFLILQKQLMFSKFPNFTFSFIISSSVISSCWIRQGGS